MSLPEAQHAGLKVLPVPEIPIVGHFAQACLATFAREHSSLLRDYVKTVLHALAWLIHHPADALAALKPELKACMKLDSDIEVKRRFNAIVNGLKTRPYPTCRRLPTPTGSLHWSIPSPMV